MSTSIGSPPNRQQHFETLDIQGWRCVILARPRQRNALSQPMMADLARLLAHAATDPGCRGVVLQGAGGYFCSGADLGGYTQVYGTGRRSYPSGCLDAEVSEGADRSAVVRDQTVTVFRALYTFPKPKIALVEGGARAAGVGLLACCDLVWATRQSDFAVGGVQLGIPPLPILPPLCRRLAPGGVRALVLTGALWGAEQALARGLIDRVDDRDLATQRQAAIGHLSQAGPGAFAMTSAFLSSPVDWDKIERDFARSMRDGEAQEGISSYFDRRLPHWTTGAGTSTGGGGGGNDG